MKKILNTSLVLILIITTVVNVVACEGSCIVKSNRIANNFFLDEDSDDKLQRDISGNFIVSDLAKRKVIINSDRQDSDSLQIFMDTYNSKWLNLTSKKLKFIENLEAKIKYKAKQDAINGFNELLAVRNRSFSDFRDLERQLWHFNLGHNYVNISWQTILNTLGIIHQDEIKNQLVNFYNIFAKVYGRDNVLRMLYRIKTEIITSRTVGYVDGRYECIKNVNNINNIYDCSFIQVMSCSQDVFDRDTITGSYNSGWWSTDNILSIITHEYGHVLGNFLRLDAANRLKINRTATNEANKWWNSNNSNLLDNDNVNIEVVDNDTNYMILALAKNTNINNPIYQKLLSFAIVRSNYGRTSHRDLFAEAFSQWIQTKPHQRNVAWEKLDQFFRIDLPKTL